MDEPIGEHDALPGIRLPAEAGAAVGHEGPRGQLFDAHRHGRMHHAWLLQGPQGIGKATLAFEFARRLLSGGSAGSDPGALARQMASGAHPNLLHLSRPPNERGGFKMQITVDEVRRLNRFFQTTSSSRQWRIAIIDPVDDMNRSAANALLKILEEPPERSLFLIVNHLPGRLLPTIRSRCRLLRFDPLPAQTIVEVLEALDLPAAKDDLTGVAEHAEGSARVAILLLSGGGLKIEERIDALISAQVPEWHGIQALADELSQKGQETAFDLALASLFTRLAADSEKAAAAGQLALARELALLWQNENERIREGLLYNLDRRQMLMTHFRRRFACGQTPAPH